jgi:porin
LIDVAYEQRFFEDRFDISIGRLAAGDDFLVSTYDYLFMQNAFDGNPVGIFFNSPGMTAYPNAAWGARVRVRPTDETYLMAGVYNGDPDIRRNAYNGANLTMDGPAFAIVEFGYQHDGFAGDPPYLGNYKVGAWYDDSSYTNYGTVATTEPAQTREGNWGLYGLFDQVALPWGNPSGNRGLGVFGSFLSSPDESVSKMPYFFTAGVVARGIAQSRPKDIVGFGAVFGQFSNELSDSQERQQLLDPSVVVQRNESVLELTYRYSMWDGGCFVQPDLQYVIHPGGTPGVENALVLGCQIGIDF